jgi:hypothetical protein
MAATREDVQLWLKQAVEQGAKYMIVVCDTYDYEDYPVYCEDAKECHEKYAEYNGKSMQTIMEVYDLSLSLDVQLNERRAHHMPKGEVK